MYTQNNSLLEHVVQISDAGRKNVLLFICNSELFATTTTTTTTGSLQKGQDAKSVFTCKSTDGKSSNNSIVGFSCFVFICRQTENLKLNSGGTLATHMDTKRGN